MAVAGLVKSSFGTGINQRASWNKCKGHLWESRGSSGCSFRGQVTIRVSYKLGPQTQIKWRRDTTSLKTIKKGGFSFCVEKDAGCCALGRFGPEAFDLDQQLGDNWRLVGRGVGGLKYGERRDQIACRCAVREGEEEVVEEQEVNEPARGKKGQQVDPVGIIKDNPFLRPFAQKLRERWKKLKDLKQSIEEQDTSLLEFATAHTVLGLHRHPYHGVEFYEWAPDAKSCSLVGDFNGWSHKAHVSKDGYLGKDDFGYFRIFVDDKLREGQSKDPSHQEYNYTVAQDSGDRDLDWDKIWEDKQEEYWDPGEDTFLHPYEDPEDEEWWLWTEENLRGGQRTNPDFDWREEAKKRNAHLGWVNGVREYEDEDDEEEGRDPVEVGPKDVESAPGGGGRRGGGQKAQRPKRPQKARAPKEGISGTGEEDPSQLPPIRQEEGDGTFRIVGDPVWEARAAKKKPYAYWIAERKGRNAWAAKYETLIPHLARVRSYFATPQGPVERVPAYATYVLPEPGSQKRSAAFWDPPLEERYTWRHQSPPRPRGLRIYEAHVGMSGQQPSIASFSDFTEKVLPYIKECGYTAVQLMGVVEHSDYASLGYKVTSFFAVSSRLGTPEDFKRLVDEAHGLGLLVLLDIVHSYAAPNEMDGLASFDGDNDCYLHRGKRGLHKRWGTRLFRYGERQVLRFLLSNLRWWVEEYRLDGFHFHSVASMLYTHNGQQGLKAGAEEYFNQYVDEDAILYLILANEMLHELKPDVITIADDLTLYPGLCHSTLQGGLGFDFRVQVAPANMWAWLLQNLPDSDWSMNEIVQTLTNRKSTERTLVYAENHSQSVVAQSLAQTLFGAALRGAPDVSDPTPELLRGVALHKMIRLLVLSLAGDAYLSFMGNEFGHPEWVEFPRTSNGHSFARARRRWDLLDSPRLPFCHLARFDHELMALEEAYGVLTSGEPVFCHISDEYKVIVFLRARLLFAFNFDSAQDYEEYRVGLPEAGEYKRILDTDERGFAGIGRLEGHSQRCLTEYAGVGPRPNLITLRLPSQAAQVYELTRTWEPS